MKRSSPTSPVLNIESLLLSATDRFASAGIEDARLTAELLLAHALKSNRVYLRANCHEEVPPENRILFDLCVERRLAHEPTQYIVGETEFMGLRFSVDRRVLIPRPETELLVEAALSLMRSSTLPASIRVLDIGTGSGNIAVSLAKFDPSATLIALDVSADALDVARSNIQLHGVSHRVRLVVGDLFSLPDDVAGEKFDFIVSNPPYISVEEFAALAPEVAEHEPRLATEEGGDGLRFYRSLAGLANSILSENGWVVVEIAYDQGEAVPEIFRIAGLRNVAVLRDYSGNERIVQGQKGL